ncbi:hypothetical protein M8C21_024327, partial [Ambrosia artemisiifolia]
SGLLHIWSILEESESPKSFHYTGEVGNASNIRFRLDRWAGDVILKDKWPDLYRIEGEKRCNVNQRLGADWHQWRWTRYPATSSELEQIREYMELDANCSIVEAKDRWKWLGYNTGVFTVNSVKKLIVKDRDSMGNFRFNWAAWVPIKCSTCVARRNGKTPHSVRLG